MDDYSIACPECGRDGFVCNPATHIERSLGNFMAFYVPTERAFIFDVRCTTDGCEWSDHVRLDATFDDADG